MALTDKQKAASKARRDKIMAAAKQGGYIPQKREGKGLSIKKTSKTGTTYYYQPWDTLDQAQKDKRIKYSKDYAAKTRAEARAYRAEHGVTSKKKGR